MVVINILAVTTATYVVLFDVYRGKTADGCRDEGDGNGTVVTKDTPQDTVNCAGHKTVDSKEGRGPYG